MYARKQWEAFAFVVSMHAVGVIWVFIRQDLTVTIGGFWIVLSIMLQRPKSAPVFVSISHSSSRGRSPFPTLRTRKDVVMPLMWPIKGVDGSEIREIAVPNNTDVIISVLGANRDKRIWGPDAEEWRPERWLEPLPQSVADAHMPGVYASM